MSPHLLQGFWLFLVVYTTKWAAIVDGDNTEPQIEQQHNHPATSQWTLIDEEENDKDEPNCRYSSDGTLIAGDENDEDYIMTDLGSDETDNEQLAQYRIPKKSTGKPKSNTFELAKTHP